MWSRPPRPPGPRSTITSKPVADARLCGEIVASGESRDASAPDGFARPSPGPSGGRPRRGRTRGLTHATIAFAYALWSACRFGSFATLGTVSSTVRLPGLVIVKTTATVRLCDSRTSTPRVLRERKFVFKTSSMPRRCSTSILDMPDHAGQLCTMSYNRLGVAHIVGPKAVGAIDPKPKPWKEIGAYRR